MNWQKGYAIAFAGSVMGAIASSILVVMVVAISGLVGFDIGLGISIYALLAGAWLGSSLGAAALLAVAGREAAWATGLTAIPVGLAVGVLVWVLAKMGDVADLGLVLVVVPLVSPFVSRWLVLIAVRD
jgi:hypothetical protein